MGAPGKILCILVLLLHKSSQQAFNANKTLNLPVNYTIGWMAALDNETLISNITIPGTHDTMALREILPAKCQSWSLEDQLKVGIRYLDLRVSGKNLEIVHGIIPQKTTFFAAFETIKGFLSTFSTETVLVRLKHEQDKFPDNVASQLKHDSNCWVSDVIPRIREVRGKVVFVQKSSFQLGVPLYQTDKNGDYKVTNIGKKKAKIIAHLNEALAASKNRDVVLSYSSGTGWFLWPIWRIRLFYTPQKVAKEINPWLYQNLNEKYNNTNPKPCFGVIAMDFPGLDLIQKVIEFNK